MPRVTDVYAALPAITGKFELEYEGELQRRRQRRPRHDPHRRSAPSSTASSPTPTCARSPSGSTSAATLQVDDTLTRRTICCRAPRRCRGCASSTRHAGVGAKPPAPLLAAAVDFILEGLYAQQKISRSDECQYPGGRTADARRAPGRRSTQRTRHADARQQEEVLQLRMMPAGNADVRPERGRDTLTPARK